MPGRFPGWLFALVMVPLMTVLAARAELRGVWQIGLDEDPFASGYRPTDEFVSENYSNDRPPGRVTRLPGDPLYSAAGNPTADDDFYCAGTFPVGFNGLTTNLPVAFNEPDTAWERALTDGDRTNRVHFFLTSQEAGPLSRLRLSAQLVSGGIWLSQSNTSGEGFGEHYVTVRFRNASGQASLLYSNRLDRDTRAIIDFAAASVAASVGANSIEFARLGPITPNVGYWIQFDYAQLEADADALADADNDGLPRWWEVDQLLSDSDPSDAGADQDGDGLTAWQEYRNGVNWTNPHRADTDDDGLSDSAELALGTNPLEADTDKDTLADGEEVNGQPASNPLLVDSDADGAPDTLERRVGTSPVDGALVPTVFRGGIGIHFVSQNDLAGTLGTNETAGYVPQTRWNDTVPLRGWSRPSGSTADVFTPVAGRVVRSDGQILTNLTVSWTAEASDASRNAASSDRKLMDGYLRANGATRASLTLGNIPFANYDLAVVVGGSGDGQKGRVRLGADSSTDRLFRTQTTAPQAALVEIPAGNTNFPYANLALFTNLTGASLTINVTNDGGWSLGICAVQVVDRQLDADASGIPDWFEMKYALQPASAALAAADSDADGLSNSHEFQRSTDPHKADTDGDGLDDGREAALGTNPRHGDTDGDGVSDLAEIRAAIPSNPLLADTDGDGQNDRAESRQGTDPAYHPTNNVNFVSYAPFFRANPSRWEWNLENVQLVWDHTAGGMAPNIYNEDSLLDIAVRNTAANDWRTLGMQLRYYRGAITHLFHSERTGGFSASNQPGSSIWDSDYGNPPADLKSKLGFSGYGPADISDRLQFRMFAQRGASSNSWSVSFVITNQTSNTLVVMRTYSNCTARLPLDSGAAQWTDYSRTPDKPSLVAHQGVRLFLTTNALAELPEFAQAKDSDDDGMPDVWEDAHLFNRLASGDATQDADADGLNNRGECLAGTNPRAADTDGDGIGDMVERTNSSNPLLVASRPAFAGQVWPTGQDLDANGLPDAWEVRYRAFGLAPGADADRDGASNALEAAWGTDPFDPGSKLAVTLTRQAGDATVQWPHQPAKDQRLLTSGTLSNWTQYPGATWLGGSVAFVTITNRLAQAPREFYSVTTADRDSDGDGLHDWAETVLGSDPARAHSAHGAVPVINSTGAVTGSISGDYASFVEQMGGPGGGTGRVTRAQAARFLQQATFGPTLRELDRVLQLGFAAWLDDQITNAAPTLHRKYIEQVYADFSGPRTDLTYSFNEMDQFINGNNCTTPFARAAIAGPDQLRQRVAFALSQILVASRRDPNLESKPLAMTDYYDIFVRNAFGNYYDVLREVTFHPVMGRYLSHIGNQKARPEINQYPDENYAREVQQLFTIGLWELHPDGTQKLDAFDQPIPTYGNAEITEFARVFTGFWFGGQSWGNGGWNDEDSSVPMQLWAEKHDFGEKRLLKGLVIPARAPTVENALREVEEALRSLFEHPNTPPFIGRQLIQFLVTSNPSSNYVARVAGVFANDGAGRRGNLAAVVKAILLDAEARDARWFAGAPEYGRLKEPVHRAMAIARAGRLDRYPDLLWWDWGDFSSVAFQEPGFSPSVFNFFRPSYQPPGLLTQYGLVGPAFQITDSYSSISFPNQLWKMTQTGLTLSGNYGFPPDYSELLPVSGDAGALADQANLLFCGGTMSAGTRDRMINALNQVASYDGLLRVRLAVYLAATCPEGAVQR